jgi:hypothetical protein
MRDLARPATIAAFHFLTLNACGGSAPDQLAGAGAGGQPGSGGGAGDAGQAGMGAISGSGGGAGSGGSGAVSSQCQATASQRLASDPVPHSRLASDGRFIYYVGATSTLSGSNVLRRVPVNGGDSELLHSAVQAFTLVGTRAFYATVRGEIGEVAIPGSPRPLATGHLAAGFASDAQRLLWSENDQQQPDSKVFSVALSGGAVALLATRPGIVGQIEATNDAIWWSERANATAVSVVRAELDGSSPRVVVPDVAGFTQFAISGDTLAIASQSGLSLGPAAGGTRGDVVGGVPVSAFAIDAQTVYFARTDACVANPMVGNGQPICKGKFFSVPMSGGTPIELFSSEGVPNELIVDSACLYFVEVIGQCHPGCSTGLGVLPR